MGCDDLDRLRTESPQSDSSAWPPEAQTHLEDCERCSQLQAVWDGSSRVDFSEPLQIRIEEAILPRLRPVSPLAGAGPVTAALILSSIVVIVSETWRLGTAGWHARSALQVFVEFLLLCIGVLVSANQLAQQMMPGSRRKSNEWLWIPLLALLAAEATLFGDQWKPDFLCLALSCWEIGIACAAVSALLFWLVVRRGFFLDPVRHGAAAGLLAGLTGVTVLEIYCPYLDRLHISVAHIGTAVTSVLVGIGYGAIKQRVRRR